MKANQLQTSRGVRLLGAAISAGALLSLTSCSPVRDIAAQFDEGEFSAVLCDSFEYNEISVFARSEGGAWQELWTASGPERVSGVGPISFGEPPDGMTSTVGPLPFEGDSVQIHFTQGELGDTAREDVWAEFQLDVISNSDWTTASGNTRAEPCR